MMKCHPWGPSPNLKTALVPSKKSYKQDPKGSNLYLVIYPQVRTKLKSIYGITKMSSTPQVKIHCIRYSIQNYQTY